jgi:hypothetical protein
MGEYRVTSEPPRHTTTASRDLSGISRGTSAEAALISGYRNARIAPARRTEDCCCDGQIVAETGWEDVRVAEHRQTPRHREWADAWLAARQ